MTADGRLRDDENSLQAQNGFVSIENRETLVFFGASRKCVGGLSM